MTKLLKFSIIINFFLSLVISSFVTKAQENNLKINKIIINGEKRLSESFILKYLPNHPDTKFSNEILNNFTKDLYKTEFFEKINIEIKDEVLIVTLKEFPIVNEISFVGNDLIENDQLLEIISIKPRDIFNNENLNIAAERIKSEYQKIGRYLAEIKIQKMDLNDGRVNLNFEINEGSLLVVKNINFSGNNVFSNSELKSNISTKEDAWYKIFGSNKFLPERLEFDKEKLRKFYYERGYIDFEIISAKGDLLPDITGFNINFILSEGKRYKINNIEFISSITKNDKLLLEKITLKQNDYFNYRALESSSNELIKYFEDKGFNFVDVQSSIKKNNNLVNIKFSISEGISKFVNRISIVGNTITNDSVIRREITLFEGDPFNMAKLKSSINSLNRLGFFQTVNYKLVNLEDNLIDIIINVKEVNTGTISFGVGYSSLDNTNITFGLKENNFLGEGHKVNLEANLSDKKSKYSLGYTEPYFLDRHLSLSGNIFNQDSENQNGDVKFNTKGLGVGIGFKEEQFFQSFNYDLYSTKSTRSSTSTANSITGEDGKDIISSSVTHTIVSDTRNSFFNPTSGYRLKYSNTLSGFGGDTSFFKSVVNFGYYLPINYGDYILSFKSGAGFVTGFDEKVTSSNRFNLSGKVIRGFDSGGVGPRDTGNDSPVGGNKFYNLSFQLRSKMWLPDDTGLEWLLFADAGSLWDTDFKDGVKGYDDMEPRVSNGFGLSMSTPVGPLQMLWGFPIVSKNYDKEENFQFSIGTSF